MWKLILLIKLQFEFIGFLLKCVADRGARQDGQRNIKV